MRPEIKEARRAGIDPKDYEAWEKKHAEWLRLYLSMNSSRPGSLAVRRVEAYQAWKKTQRGPLQWETSEGKDLLAKIDKSV